MSADLQWAGSVLGCDALIHVVGQEPLPKLLREPTVEFFTRELPAEIVPRWYVEWRESAGAATVGCRTGRPWRSLQRGFPCLSPSPARRCPGHTEATRFAMKSVGAKRPEASCSVII